MSRYIHQIKAWPEFSWNHEQLATMLASIRYRQGHLMGRMEALGFSLRSEALVQTITLEVIKSNEIEGELLNLDQVRSSVARQLGLDLKGLVPSGKKVDGVVEMMLDATQHFNKKLTKARLLGWHASLFPEGHGGPYRILVGKWRKGPIQVVSGAMGREKVHFDAPEAARLDTEMKGFISWFNEHDKIDPVLKAGIAHFWFVTVHPFNDGNGRIARTLADMLLARADGSSQRFYSMSAQILRERKAYYDTLEKCQKGTLDLTPWLKWFLQCLEHVLKATEGTLAGVMRKARFWETHAVTQFNDRQRIMLNKLFDGFEGKLVTSKWAKINKCSQDTALRDIQELMEKEILVKEEGGGRSTGYKLKV